MRSLFTVLPGRRREAARHEAARLRAEIAAHGAEASRVLALANALEAAGAVLDAIEALTAANRLRRDMALERHLVRLRRRAFGALDWPAVTGPPPASAGHPPRSCGTPSPLEPASLTSETLRAGIGRHGCVWVRGLVPPPRVAQLHDVIDRAFDAREARLAGRPTADAAAWYDELERVPKDGSRTWIRAGQGLLAADSPRGLFEFLDSVHVLGIDRLIADYLGERPSLSVEKTVLRRADASLHASAWHQDGAFLGDGIRTLDAWFALTRCGRDAPGLEVMPVRLGRVLPTGGAGTYLGWTVSPETIARELPGVPIWRPEFEAGDVLLFDHLLLHRTAADPDMPGVRYAIESWFFASSVYPKTSTALVV
jgi:hypothetical protein